MKIIRILLGAITGFALAGNVYAANKTHVTDTLGAGNSRIDISYEFGSSSLPGTFIFAGGPSYSDDLKISTSRLAVEFNLGATDRLDVGFFLPFVENTKITETFAGPGVTGTLISKYEGQGDIVIGAQYLILDKNLDRVSWNVTGTISPATAPDDPGSPEYVLNGTLINPGITGDTGNGYMTTGIASTISIPAGAGDVYLGARFYNYGERTWAGVTHKRGSSTSFTVGLENMVGETVTLTPYANFNFEAASTNSSGIYFAASSSYDLGLRVTNDLSNSVSVQLKAAYNVINDIAVIYPNGDWQNNSGNGYDFGLSAMFFF